MALETDIEFRGTLEVKGFQVEIVCRSTELPQLWKEVHRQLCGSSIQTVREDWIQKGEKRIDADFYNAFDLSIAKRTVDKYS